MSSANVEIVRFWGAIATSSIEIMGKREIMEMKIGKRGQIIALEKRKKRMEKKD